MVFNDISEAGQVGVSSTHGRLPLQLLTKQKCVAWRWPQVGLEDLGSLQSLWPSDILNVSKTSPPQENGVMQYMVGIGCSQPFSPFTSEEGSEKAAATAKRPCWSVSTVNTQGLVIADATPAPWETKDYWTCYSAVCFEHWPWFIRTSHAKSFQWK